MYKTGILNSEISKVLSDLGHTDTIIIADCGLPVPDGVKKIDLALTFGHPSFEEVFNVVKEHMAIEQLTIANEMIKQNSELYVKLLAENIDMITESHETLKMYSKETKAIIRTGEATPYANVILSSGVLF
ncbi:D-ribose pyranase [Staphylococcus cohnii species complex 1658]|uniref:D-ribose pyranase n=1 Tax=Staphylococcus TaxID=1279 RepID=UPI000619F08D|nr:MULTISPECIES: D-ribose pyranase [Staphylococcus]KKD21972.1 ribose ABC transporter [Staphylococcus cohnii subsp. cohnii]PTG45518.1 D-ribose pyranase [Staphylococcus cohnii]KKD24987.1 ribose ABC transporter [Staphylococcus cohnii subsp. cohnii]MDQ7110327.1 D-ribose pyranase [Staphylococcus ureilyticus]MDU9348862.1 D-ribose pyranase [Staphylococcus ureilyticus]